MANRLPRTARPAYSTENSPRISPPQVIKTYEPHPPPPPIPPKPPQTPAPSSPVPRAFGFALPLSASLKPKTASIINLHVAVRPACPSIHPSAAHSLSGVTLGTDHITLSQVFFFAPSLLVQRHSCSSPPRSLVTPKITYSLASQPVVPSASRPR